MPTVGAPSTDVLETLSHTLAAGTNRIVVAKVWFEYKLSTHVTVTGVTYGGVAMTVSPRSPVDSIQDGGGQTGSLHVFYLLEADLPADGAQNVVVNGASEYDEIGVAAYTLFDAAQTAWTTDNTAAAVFNVEPSTQITTSVDGSLVVDGVGFGTPATSTPGAGQTELFDFNTDLASAALAGSHDTVDTAGGRTFSWTHGQTVNFVSHFMVAVAPSVTPASADAGPDQNVSAGAVVTLDASASTKTGGASVVDGDGTWSQTGGTTVTLSDTTAVQPTFTAPSPSSQTTLTFRYTVDGDSDDVSIVVAATENQRPTVNPSADPSTATVGTLVTLTAGGGDPDGDATTVLWVEPSGATLSSTTAEEPTWDTTGATPGDYEFSVTRSDGSLTSTSKSVIVSVAEAGEPVGAAVTPKFTIPAPAGTATVRMTADIEAIGGNDLAAGEQAKARLAGTFSAPTDVWGVPGDPLTEVQVSDDYDPATGVGTWSTIVQDVGADELGVVVSADRRYIPGRTRYVRARVAATTPDRLTSDWSAVVSFTPQPSSAWVKPLDDDGGDLGLDIPVVVRVDEAHTRDRNQGVRYALDGTSSVRTSGRTPRRGSITFLAETTAEREQIHNALEHMGTVLLQFFLDDDGTGENIYLRWTGTDATKRIVGPDTRRDITVGWVEVAAP